MTREHYQVEVDGDGRKSVHYTGFLWRRDNADGEVGADGEPLDYACTTGSWCFVPVAGNEGRLEEAVAEAFERVQQYQEDLTEAGYLDYMESWGACPALHLDDVTEETPEGAYHYDAGGWD